MTTAVVTRRTRAVSTARTWADRLFPPARPSLPASRCGIVVAVGLVLAAAGLSLLRQPGVPAVDTIWAEDGQVFYNQAVQWSFLHSLFTPYNGYFQLVPRVMIESVTLLPVDAAAAAIAIEAAIVTGLFALLVYVASGPTLRTVPLRLSAATVAVLPMVGMIEILNNLANVHWAGLYAVFWVALWTPSSRAGRVVGFIATLAVSCTNILAVLLLPLLVVRAATRKDRHSLALVAAGLVGAAANVLALTLGTAERVGVDLNFGRSLSTYLSNVLPVSTWGEHVMGPVGTAVWGHRLLWLASYGALLVVFALAMLRRRQANWPVALLAFVHSLAFWVIAFGITAQMASRYAALADMLLVSGIAAMFVPGTVTEPRRPLFVPRQVSTVDAPESTGAVPADPPGPWWRPIPATAPGFAVLGVLLLLIAVNFRTDNQRALGPRWSDGLTAARAECARTADRGDEGDGTALVPIAPDRWGVRVPCQDLRP